MDNTIINFEEKFSKLNEQFSPRIVAQLNNYYFKICRFQGGFVWHKHSDTDEAFFVLEGEMKIYFRDKEVAIVEGELFVVPKDVTPGNYSGSVNVAVGGTIITKKKFTVHVWDFKLPEHPDFLFPCGGPTWRMLDPQSTKDVEIWDNYSDFMLSYGLIPAGIAFPGRWSSQQAAILVNDRRVNAINFGAWRPNRKQYIKKFIDPVVLKLKASPLSGKESVFQSLEEFYR